MRYKSLLIYLQSLTDEQLECNITVNDPYTNEFYAVVDIKTAVNIPTLDENHPYLVLKA